MDDLISRAAVLNDISDLMKSPWYNDGKDGERHLQYLVRKDAVEIVKVLCVKKAPAVDAAPVVHGRWIDENPDDSLDPRMRCSICTGVESPLIKWRYCPNCGAKMDGERRDEA